MTFVIHTHRWHPAEPQAGAPGIYLLHGVGEHAGRYDRFAQHLASQGYEVAAHDHPGHGRSDGKRGIIEEDRSLVDEAKTQLAHFALETGTAPILFGHSLGGVVAATLAMDKSVKLAGLILSAPALVPNISRLDRFKLNALSIIAPYYVQELQYDASRLTQDEIEQKIAENDPLIHGFKSANLINWIVNAGYKLTQSTDQFNVPTLVLIPEDDPIVDAERSIAFAENLPQEIATSHRYTDFRHEILNETPERRARVTTDIDNWLTAQFG